jgi:hypothetical protein
MHDKINITLQVKERIVKINRPQEPPFARAGHNGGLAIHE